MTILYWCIGIYLVCGLFITALTSDPEQDGWLWTILLWPLQLLSKIV